MPFGFPSLNRLYATFCSAPDQSRDQWVAALRNYSAIALPATFRHNRDDLAEKPVGEIAVSEVHSAEHHDEDNIWEHMTPAHQAELKAEDEKTCKLIAELERLNAGGSWAEVVEKTD